MVSFEQQSSPGVVTDSPCHESPPDYEGYEDYIIVEDPIDNGREPGNSTSHEENPKIAGFSQQELLKIINLVKLGYYVWDDFLNNGKSGELQGRGYKIPSQFKSEGYKIFQFYNKYKEGKYYRHAGCVFINGKEVTVVYRGSRNLFDYMMDAKMALCSDPELFPEGGKVHSGFYDLFKDSWESVYSILKGYANNQGIEIKDLEVVFTGHSMGGAIANIAAFCLSVTENIQNVRVATFGSPRLFDSLAAKRYSEVLGDKTVRVANLADIVTMVPLGAMYFEHVGQRLNLGVYSFPPFAHHVDIYRALLQSTKNENFKPCNSKSSYYYLSYVAALFYYIITLPSFLIKVIQYLFPNGEYDEEYFEGIKKKCEGDSLAKTYKPRQSNILTTEVNEPDGDGFVIIDMQPTKPRGISREFINLLPLMMGSLNIGIDHKFTNWFINRLSFILGSLNSKEMAIYADLCSKNPTTPELENVIAFVRNMSVRVHGNERAAVLSVNNTTTTPVELTSNAIVQEIGNVASMNNIADMFFNNPSPTVVSFYISGKDFYAAFKITTEGLEIIFSGCFNRKMLAKLNSIKSNMLPKIMSFRSSQVSDVQIIEDNIHSGVSLVPREAQQFTNYYAKSNAPSQDERGGNNTSNDLNTVLSGLGTTTIPNEALQDEGGNNIIPDNDLNIEVYSISNENPDQKSQKRSKGPIIILSGLGTTTIFAALITQFALEASLLASALTIVGAVCIVTAIVLYYREPSNSLANPDLRNGRVGSPEQFMI